LSLKGYPQSAGHATHAAAPIEAPNSRRNTNSKFQAPIQRILQHLVLKLGASLGFEVWCLEFPKVASADVERSPDVAFKALVILDLQPSARCLELPTFASEGVERSWRSKVKQVLLYTAGTPAAPFALLIQPC
jgi:hypothetical protein